MALGHGIADQRVLGLQVQDVKLVDARRDDQERLLVNLCSQRLVFKQLEQLVLEDHRALGGRHVLAHREHGLIGHGHMALAEIVDQVLQPFGNALALGLDSQLLRFGVESQKVAGRTGRCPLLHRETQARHGLGIGTHRVDKCCQRAGLDQVRGSSVRGQGVVGPGRIGKATVGTDARGLWPHGHQSRDLFLKVGLHRRQLGGFHMHRRHVVDQLTPTSK